VVVRRGRWKTVCARGADPALVRGRSTSPLGVFGDSVPTVMPASALTGRLLVLIAFAVTLLGDLVVISLKISQVGLSASTGSIFRWLSTIALFYAIWRGYAWARWLVVGFLGLGLILVLLLMQWRGLDALAIGVALQFSTALVLLAFPRSVTTFLGYQHARYRDNT